MPHGTHRSQSSDAAILAPYPNNKFAKQDLQVRPISLPSAFVNPATVFPLMTSSAGLMMVVVYAFVCQLLSGIPLILRTLHP